jgi:hypothetical protein
MDTVTILRDLWRMRPIVAAVTLIALLAGTFVVFKITYPLKVDNRRYEVGVATARILVDTPSSQVVEVAPKGSDSLGVRANLLASLMVDGVVKAAIAQRAGLPAKKLVGLTEAAAEPTSVTPAQPRPRDFVLRTRVLTNTSGDQLPIIEIEAQAPTRTSAARLGAAAVAGLRDYLDSTAALQQVTDADRLRVTGLGAPEARTVVRGPSNVIAILVVIVVFGLGCAGILGVLALTRGWRAAMERDELGDEALFAEDVEPAPDETPSEPSHPSRPALVAPPRTDDWFAAEHDDRPQVKRA